MLRVIFALLFILNGFVSAQKKEKETLADVEARIAELTAISEQSIAKEKGLEWPLIVPEKTIAQIKKETDEKIAAEAIAKFPTKPFEEFMAEQEKMYPVYAIGDKVKISYRYRNGSKIAEGDFKELTEKTLRIYGESVPVVDVEEKVLISFDPELRKTVLTREAKRHFAKYNVERDILTENLTKANLTAPYLQAGYKMVNGEWKTAEQIVKVDFDAVQAKLATENEKAEKMREEEAKVFKLMTKTEDGKTLILGQDPKIIYIAGGVLLLLIIGVALKKK